MVGVWLLAFVAAFPTVLEVLPRASLAAILVFVGYKLVRHRPYAELRRYGISELVIYVISIAIIVGVNLLTGILVGIGLALAKLLYSIGRGFHRLDVRIEHDSELEQTHVFLERTASFIRLPKLAATLEKLSQEHEVHLHVEKLQYIDHACLDIITKWERQRIQARLPVRVEWDYLHHKYHAKNPLDATPEEHAEAPDQEHRLLDFVQADLVFINDDFKAKKQAIEELGRRLVRYYGLEVDGDALIDSVLARENESSTCLGEGLMIPHGILESRHALLGVLAISHRGWDFETPDGKPVRCIALLATPQESAAQHLAVLAAFARLFSRKPELRDSLLQLGDADAVVGLLRSDEAAEVNYSFERLTSTKVDSLRVPRTGD